jgi:hypothetical protein
MGLLFDTDLPTALVCSTMGDSRYLILEMPLGYNDSLQHASRQLKVICLNEIRSQ